MPLCALRPSGLDELRCTDAVALGLAAGAFDWACSSHIIEHFVDPELHVPSWPESWTRMGRTFFLTPNEPADFENPFHPTPLRGERSLARPAPAALRATCGWAAWMRWGR